MLDFRLHVFYTVAKRLSFTKAAAELFITQPAVTKHIHELEQQFGVALFERRGKQISLTPAGELALHHAELIQANYRQLEYDLNQLKGLQAGALRLGASSTVAQYVLPPVLARFHERYPDIAISLISGNTEQIEQALLHNDIDMGLVEGRTHGQEIRYTPFVQDEIVLVTHREHPLAQQDEITLEVLRTLPLVLRERGSGTLEIIEHALRQAGLKLTDLSIAMYLGSTESIKSYLFHARSVAFISIYAIENELRAGTLRILDVQDLTIRRTLYSVQKQGDSDALTETFLRFARRHYNQT
ncbi:LysR family transcriptional regulator [Rhabdobacter roseus]|uniref:DNA-binding transcriptional LysR family regulator n=1 Tax=Rhabdobacter roseus TaxID=1655419 RepID=A0A840TIU5_9BACT|nr:LysR family transcriptional regulator [Rhabdobacter roseus]MBB5284106.1 DNA-binding transcriptional LysR family regulator [Rhabdobacter roseus]